MPRKPDKNREAFENFATHRKLVNHIPMGLAYCDRRNQYVSQEVEGLYREWLAKRHNREVFL